MLQYCHKNQSNDYLCDQALIYINFLMKRDLDEEKVKFLETVCLNLVEWQTEKED